MNSKLLISFFLMGLSLGLGPCLVSCGPLLISYLAGTQKGIPQSLLAYLIFSFSRVSVYLALGLGAFLFGKLSPESVYGSFSRYSFIFGGIFIAIIGLLLVFGKGVDLKFCRRLDSFLIKKDKKTIFVFGLILGIMPCLPLVSLLYYIGLVSRNPFDSLVYSISFGLGTVVSPLFVLSAASGLLPKLFEKSAKLYSIFNSVCGLVIVALGIQLITRGFR